MDVKRASPPAPRVSNGVGSFDATKTVAVARAAVGAFEQSIRPSLQDGSAWGAFLSPVEGRAALGRAEGLIQGIIDTVPAGQRMPARAMAAIDSIMQQLTAGLPKASMRDVEPQFHEELMALISADKDENRLRVDPAPVNAVNRQTYAELKKLVASHHQR